MNDIHQQALGFLHARKKGPNLQFISLHRAFLRIRHVSVCYLPPPGLKKCFMHVIKIPHGLDVNQGRRSYGFKTTGPIFANRVIKSLRIYLTVIYKKKNIIKKY